MHEPAGSQNTLESQPNGTAQRDEMPTKGLDLDSAVARISFGRGANLSTDISAIQYFREVRSVESSAWHNSGIRPASVMIWLRAAARDFTRGKRGAGILIFFLLSGCTSNKLAGVEEYRQITAEALTRMSATLKALEQVTASGDSSPKRVGVFSRELQRLEVSSIRVRARAQAIQLRGDAYFAAWSENISSIKDSRVRDLAETHHAELEKSFSNIKTSSRDAGAAFRPFLTDLTRLRAELESHPAAALSPSETNLIAAARDNGQKVLKQLTAINFELTVISTMLDPSKAPARS
jgi:hypothetical protein